MTDLLIPDWSEYQRVDHARAAAWLRQRNGGGAAAIFRLCYSDTHVDTEIDYNLDHADLYDVLGLYAYLKAGVDPRSQAGVAARIIRAHGGLRRTWFVVCDDEESTGGDESGRVNAFLDELDAQLQTPNPAGEDWWYSGLNFGIAHNLPAARGHRFIAAYQGVEPDAIAHDLWQNTDAQVIDGVSGPCDASIFHGSIDDLRALIGAGGTLMARTDDLVERINTEVGYDDNGQITPNGVAGVALAQLASMQAKLDVLAKAAGVEQAALDALAANGGAAASVAALATKLDAVLAGLPPDAAAGIKAELQVLGRHLGVDVATGGAA